MLKGKNVLIGVCGGIAAYKACELISLLKTEGCSIYTMMTRSAQEFITPLTLGTLTGHNVACDMFNPPENYEVEHISLVALADVIILIPATANVIGKIACGIADDFLTTTVMASKAPCIIAPAMNTGMYENPVVQENIAKLKDRGYLFVEPVNGRLACKTVGKGHLAPVEQIFDAAEAATVKKDLSGKKVLVTAGPTREAIDPVRFISNRSTGKMGYAVAKAAKHRGAEVTLVTGHTEIEPPYGVKVVKIESAVDMHREVISRAADYDVIIKSAAVGDFRPAIVSDNKIKKSDMGAIALEKNPDILAELGGMGLSAKLVGFSMETENLLENSAKKLKEKNLDFIIANNLKTEGAGFGTDTNVVTVIGRDGAEELAIMSKQEVAHAIFDRIVKL